MIYTILETKQSEETIITKVEYDFDGYKVEVDISHFMPESLKSIENAIINRGYSEKRKVDATNASSQLIDNITVGEVVSIDTTVTDIESEKVKSEFDGISNDELNAQIELLSIEYNDIIEHKSKLEQQLTENSNKYDLLISELKNRI